MLGIVAFEFRSNPGERFGVEPIDAVEQLVVAELTEELEISVATESQHHQLLLVDEVEPGQFDLGRPELLMQQTALFPRYLTYSKLFVMEKALESKDLC